MSSRLRAAAVRLENWLKDEAIPLWLAVGMDSRNHAHYEQLLADGSVDVEADIRVRVQARQAFAYAFAYHRGWAGENARRAAEELMTFINARAARKGGGYAHLLNADFEVVDWRLDLYNHAFHLLANAWCHRAFDDAAALERAEALMSFLDQRLGSEHGGWLEGNYEARHRRQNPHMHLFEAFLALYARTRDQHWLVRADEIFNLFQSHFYDHKRQLLLEFFEEDWSPATDGAAQVVEPGHMLEWVWLLDRYSRLADRPVAELCRSLYRKALDIGQTPSGLILDQVNAVGKPAPLTKRCWPMTELVKANLVMARLGDANAEEKAADAVEALFRFYLCAPTPGAYIDQRGPDDEVLVGLAPASTVYHLVTVAAELVDYCHASREL